MKYQQLRRIPQTSPGFLLARKTLPIVFPTLKAVRRAILADMLPPGGPVQRSLEVMASDAAEYALNRTQDIFFEEPGLDTLLVRDLSRIGKAMIVATRIRLWFYIALGFDKDGVAARNRKRLPRIAYDSLMLTALALGKSLGYFTGGKVHSQLWWDSEGLAGSLPAGHPEPNVRRKQPPQSLGDLAADIDDLYWAEAYGQVLKITQVGVGDERRWLVSLPGTDHPEPESQPNAADLETNMREELNIPSSMRIGVIQAIHAAMGADGIPPNERIDEKVLVCGHSQGGMIAVSLAAADPQEIGFTVSGVITLGSPTRRHKINEGVAMLAVEHDQDVIPSMDGAPRRHRDHRVVAHRSLVKPRVGALYYAHSSATYTDTLRWLEKRAAVTGWGRQSEVIKELQTYLPADDDPTRVTHHYVWQETGVAHVSTTWNEFLELNSNSWDPALYGTEIVVDEELTPVPQEIWSEVEAEIERIRLRAHPRFGKEVPGDKS